MARTSKLFEYGLDAAKVGRGLIEPEFSIRSPQRMLNKAAHYWPPETLSFRCSVALVDIVLLRSKEASVTYHKAVKALELPGNQALILDTKTEVLAYDSVQHEFTEAVLKSTQKRQLVAPSRLYTYADNIDYQFFIQCIRDYIRIGFNRRIDRDNNAYKVRLEGAPTLFGYIVIRAIAEHCKVSLEKWNKYRPDAIDSLMSGNPTVRSKRLSKKQYIQA